MIALLSKKFSIITVILLAVFPVISHSAEVNFATDVSFRTENVTENYYVAGGNIDLEANFEKDLFVLGGTININGAVAGDVIVLGGQVNVNNEIAGDLRVVGGNVNISGKVSGDLVIVGGEVFLNDSATIEGESIIIAVSVFQNATISGESNILAGSVVLNDDISGQTQITTQSITFDSSARIIGDLNYYAPKKATENPGSEVSGNINFNEIKTIGEMGIVKSTVLNLLSFWLILRFVTTLILAFILIQVFKVFTQGTADIAMNSFVKSFFFGVLSLILVPAIVVVLFISLIGLPIGFLLMIFYIFVLILSGAISGIVVGNLVHELFGKSDRKVSFQKATVGIILLTTLQFVDILGEATILIFGFVSIGATLRFIYRSVIHKS
jgi:cytoskeletal protein CcmA (bactofilin family)